MIAPLTLCIQHQQRPRARANGTMAKTTVVSSRRKALPFIICVLCVLCLCSGCLFSIPKAEPRSPIPRKAVLEREMTTVSEMTKLSRKLEGTLPGNVVALSTKQDLAEVLERACAPNRIVVVDYYAPWCRACQKLLRYVQKLARSADFAEVEFATVDFDQSDELVTSRAVNQLPTLEIYRGQELKQRWSGANTKRRGDRGKVKVWWKNEEDMNKTYKTWWIFCTFAPCSGAPPGWMSQNVSTELFKAIARLLERLEREMEPKVVGGWAELNGLLPSFHGRTLVAYRFPATTGRWRFQFPWHKCAENDSMDHKYGNSFLFANVILFL